MKTNLLIALMFLSLMFVTYPSHSKEIWFLGDSLSSGANSHVEILNKTTDHQIRNLARAGMRWVDLEVPRFIRCAKGIEVVIWLGGNDAIYNTHAPWLVEAIVDNLQFLQGRNCKVTLILPPKLTFREDIDKRLVNVRDIMIGIAIDYENVTVIEPLWDNNQLLDGVHQNDGLHMWQAYDFYYKLGLDEE